MGARGGGGARVGDQSPPTPLKKLRKLLLSKGGGGNSRQLSPLNKIHYLHGRLFAAFSLPFLHGRAFLLRFSHYNFAPAEGGRASFGVRPSLKNEEKIMFCYMRGLFATFFSMCFFSQLFTMGEPFCYFFSMLEAFFVFMEEGGFFWLAPSY